MDERRVGIRELNQNSAQILRSLEEFGSVVVTDHGKPIALITPYQQPKMSNWERMLRDGDVKQAVRRDLFDRHPQPSHSGLSSDELLAETRGDR